MVDPNEVQLSKAIQRRTGRTFHLATRLLPESIRHATYVLYAFFRIADDVVDDPDPEPAAVQRERLDEIRAGVLEAGEPADPVLRAFRGVKRRYAIPDAEVEEFLAAMEEDIDPPRYDTHEQLDGYLRGSSVAVAYMMLSVMDPDDEERAKPHAKALGEALQLTNFLRDVREDVLEYDRIYLPRRVLESHGVSDAQVRRLEFSPGFAEVMRAELERTERLYRRGVEGIRFLPNGSQFAVLLAATLYAGHHRLIRARGYDVLSDRPTLSPLQRLGLLARTWWHWRRTGDPVAAFEAVSSAPRAVPAPDAAPSTRPARRPSRQLVGAVRALLPGGASK